MGNTAPTPWLRQSSVIHADCVVYSILKERWENAQQAVRGDFFVMNVPDWTVAIAQTESGDFILVNQFRFGSASLSWELPAGVIDSGEDPVEAAQRELLEESGYIGECAELIGSVSPNPAIQRNKCHFVLIQNARRKHSGRPDPHEYFEITEISRRQLDHWLSDGTIHHAIVHTAIYLLDSHLRSGR